MLVSLLDLKLRQLVFCLIKAALFETQQFFFVHDTLKLMLITKTKVKAHKY